MSLDPGSRIFTEAPVRPIVVAPASAVDATTQQGFDGAADLIAVGDETVDLDAALGELRARGLNRLLCEGGPSLFASLLAADLVDELCVTVAPQLNSGDARRIVAGEPESPRAMSLTEVLTSGSELLLRYRRDRSSSHTPS